MTRPKALQTVTLELDMMQLRTIHQFIVPSTRIYIKCETAHAPKCRGSGMTEHAPLCRGYGVTEHPLQIKTG